MSQVKDSVRASWELVRKSMENYPYFESQGLYLYAYDNGKKVEVIIAEDWRKIGKIIQEKNLTDEIKSTSYYHPFRITKDDTKCPF